MIPGEFKHVESLMKLAKRKRNLETMDNQVSMVSTSPTIRKFLYQQDTSKQDSPFACRNK
jgi:hypothetical protein